MKLKFAGTSVRVCAAGMLAHAGDRWATVEIWKEVNWLSLSRIEQLHWGRVQAAELPMCGMRISPKLNQGIHTHMSRQLQNIAPC